MFHLLCRRRAGLATASALLLVAALIGCGGGGGSSQTVGRSYVSVDNNRTVALSTDSSQHFTLFARDATALPGGAGAQGLLSNGQFTATSEDGSVVFTGALSSDSQSVTGSVQRNGQTLFTFTAPSTQSRSTASGLPGTYTGASGADRAFLTVDNLTSHATLWARIGGTAGGSLLNVADNGALTSDNGSAAGQLTQNGGSLTLQVTKLNGQAVNARFTLSRVSRAKWTFLVFLNGANNLQEFGPLNVNQMEKVGSTGDVNIVVQWKQASCASCGRPDWVSTRRYFITKDNNTAQVNSQIVEDLGTSIDMGDWRELRNFILWTQQRYPADHYALVIWNHGAGWRQTRGNRLYVPPRSVSIDDSTNNEIQTWQLPQALDVTPQMDMVIFDASLMQMAEVAYEIRNSTRVIVGSEESPPGQGYFYDTFLSDLAANPAMTAAQFGTQIVNRTLEAYGPDGNNTQSALDTSKLPGVATALNTFANSLLAHTTDSRAAMINARKNAQSYAYAENKDLWDYAELIKTQTTATDLKNAATGMQQALAAAIIAEAHGSINADSHGLAIYVPEPAAYDPRYTNLAITRVTDWARWLQNQPP